MICDLAQFYHIYDYHEVPAKTLAVLVSGLDENSRVHKAANGVKTSPETLFLAGIFDDLNALLWDGKHKKPDRILPTLYADYEKEEKEGIVTYDNPEDLMKRREEIMKLLQEKQKKKDAQKEQDKE